MDLPAPNDTFEPEHGVRRRRTGGATPEEIADALDYRRLQQDLRQAAESGALTLHYQPRFGLASGALTGAEALIRWPHRRRGLIPPERFIPLAEQMGLIEPIGAWVLREACAEAATWPAPSHPAAAAAALGVNISARQLVAPGFTSQIAAALDASGLPPERMELELTEAMLLTVDEDILFILAALRDMGVGLALDDFGIGHASLTTLRRVPLTALKIDRSLVRSLPDDAEDAAIVRAVVQTGRAMDLTVVAEGVETEAQRDFLVRIGVDDGQGHLFGRAGPADRLHRLLAA